MFVGLVLEGLVEAAAREREVDPGPSMIGLVTQIIVKLGCTSFTSNNKAGLYQ